MADTRPDLDAVAAVIATNLVAPAGVVFLDWSIAVLVGVYVAELVAVVGWSLVKIPFAAKRPRGRVEQSRVNGLLHRLRGSIPLPGPVPAIYPRNLPPLFGGLFIAPIGIVLALALFGGVAADGVADNEGATIVLGALIVFLLRGGETVLEYFIHGGYRDHSPRSAFAPPFMSMIGVMGLLATALAIDAAEVGTGPSEAVLMLLVGGKLLLDLQGLRIEADEDRHGLLARMFGSTDTAVDPEPVEEPDCEPPVVQRPPRAAALADAIARGLAYALASGATVFVLSVALVVGLAAGLWGGVAVAVLVLVPSVFVRGLARYLTYGAVEYRCYDGLVVVHSTLLGEGQRRLRRGAVDGVETDRDPVDRLFGTETLDLDAEGPDTTPEFGLPDPDEADVDDANEDRPVTAAHVRDADAIVDALGVRWIAERDR
ncbi:hypothetical protein JCM30237_04460 [Halolamina litorea]|uniref:DUF6498-containing protein n=1 Tax=Halolamina litorea TaxID=1515593 RepID=A0ABD6BQL4_9EURY|nr:DUF6498-containing protein [Halolamina litorea]